MELWFTEFHSNDAKMSIRVDKHLHSEQSEYQ
ncbi:MAG: spermidine synthase, partial [Oscillospiraceae bacterium]|nr:spermidine synthase [Oscillospiraceae bacterium]